MTEYFPNYLRFGIGIFLNVFPIPYCQFPFHSSIKFTVGCVVPQPVAENNHSLGFLTSYGKHMQVNLRTLSLEHSVFEPFRFPYSERISYVLQRTDI